MDYRVDGQCPNTCGRCCTSVLPINDYEIKKVKQYIKKKGIEAEKWNDGVANYVDKCPFLNEDNRCNIYLHRFEICKHFSCGGNDEPFFHKDKSIRNLYEVFFPDKWLCPDKPDAELYDKIYQNKKKKVYNK